MILTSCQYIRGRGMQVTFYVTDFGFNVLLPEYWTIATIARYLHELMDFYEVDATKSSASSSPATRPA